MLDSGIEPGQAQEGVGCNEFAIFASYYSDTKVGFRRHVDIQTTLQKLIIFGSTHPI